MRRYRIVAIAQVYNELRRGNLPRFLDHLLPVVDALVVYDDGSTDGSDAYVRRYTPHLIRGDRHDFLHEIGHKQLLLAKALSLAPDFILWLDADEVLTNGAESELQKICDQCVRKNLDGVQLHEFNLWRSRSWCRVDNAYDEGWFTRLWRVKPSLAFPASGAGLHQPQVPPQITRTQRVGRLGVIHYGFATDECILAKYLHYQRHGQTGFDVQRLIDERTLKVKPIRPQLLPPDLRGTDEAPRPRPLLEWYTMMQRRKDELLRPRISIICLIYRSVQWLAFIHDQIRRYTNLSDKEFFFVANAATEPVKAYLRDHYLPHYVFEPPVEHRGEWYLNNVYRAWNYGAQHARGDYLLFVNSDMAFRPDWVERLWDKLSGENCVTSRLVESGKMPSGQYGISRNFGRRVAEYDEQGFLAFSAQLSEPSLHPGGLYMPLLIQREHFLAVGGYPEGNVRPGADLFSPTISLPGRPCIPGDQVLMRKLQTIGVTHQTSFDSVVYHFQEGEQDAPEGGGAPAAPPTVVVANDYLTGRMGEQTMWNFLLRYLPGTVPLDTTVTGAGGNFATTARAYLQRHYPAARVIIQNATYIDLIQPDCFTIAYLQDDLRGVGRPSPQQEDNLRRAHLRVANSCATAAAYPEFDFTVIPIGVDETLFQPGDRALVRRQLNIGGERVGIFVGDLSEVKGWAQVRRTIERHPEITWLIVSKGDRQYRAPNVRMYHRIPQAQLARLYQAADFFILGSAVETQCLAAIEACCSGLPVIMRPVGVFREFTAEERHRCGIFGDDFEAALRQIEARSFSPRAVMIARKLRVTDMVAAWWALLVDVLQCQPAVPFALAAPRVITQPQAASSIIRFTRKFMGWVRQRLRRSLPPRLYQVFAALWRAMKGVIRPRLGRES